MFKRVMAAGAVLLVGLCGAAKAEILIEVDKSEQRMTVTVDGAQAHVWPVSTGRAGFGTPNGQFRAQWLARRWYSRQYYNSPMPHSIFFHKGYAIHGTNYIRRLGGPASHGCVRLHPGNAATLFALVSKHGKANTRIVVRGGTAAVAGRGASRIRRARPAVASRASLSSGRQPAYRFQAYPGYYVVPAPYY